MAPLEASARSRVTRAGTERGQTSTRPAWGSWLESVEVGGDGGDSPESRGTGLTWQERGLGPGTWEREKADQTPCTEGAPQGQRGTALSR